MLNTQPRSTRERVIWGIKTNKLMLIGIIPNSVFEEVYENHHYWAVLVHSPNNQRILNFQQTYDKIKRILGDKLLPVYQLVEKGVFASYFVVYIKKDSLAA